MEEIPRGAAGGQPGEKRVAPRVAIVVLTWNGRDLTLDCVASLSRLAYPDYQIIVVDNGSCDGTAEAIRRRYPGVAVLENGENRGFAEGNNVGIARALADGADYVLLLNNDTVVDPQAVGALVAIAESDSQIGVVGPLIYYHDRPAVVWSAGNAVSWRTMALERLHADTRAGHPGTPFEVDYVTGCALCIKRRVIERIGLIDPRFFIYFEETDWCFRARDLGYRAVVVPQARIWHKVSATMGQESPATTYYMTRNAFLFLGKHRRGARRVGLLGRAWLREVRIVVAHTVQPRHRHLRRNRDARALALRDALLRRWGRMTADAARVCYSDR